MCALGVHKALQMTGSGLAPASGAAQSTMHRPANLWACSHTWPQGHWAPMLMQSSSAAEVYLTPAHAVCAGCGDRGKFWQAAGLAASQLSSACALPEGNDISLPLLVSEVRATAMAALSSCTVTATPLIGTHWQTHDAPAGGAGQRKRGVPADAPQRPTAGAAAPQ